ncbi:hypothetical protein [Aquabacterium humicola]|uniref:hypothetical protein n=1 Tax=Aquabacterium humicola TaxID=3237377 RepID=UPI002542CBF1|nr:hypothetical protein [Rubrivivax pictus]
MKVIPRVLLSLALALPLAAWSALVTIGSGQMVANGPSYKLIWDNDNNGKSLVWLDFTVSSQNPTLSWWHPGAVNASLVYTLDPNYAIAWTDAAWRQPGDAGVQYCQCPSTSELGHLFYVEFGLTAPLVNVQNPYNMVTAAELNAGEFDSLLPMNYWQATEWPGSYFHMGRGHSVPTGWIEGPFAGIAVREGQVSIVAPTSEPSTVLLMALALAAMRLRWRR